MAAMAAQDKNLRTVVRLQRELNNERAGRRDARISLFDTNKALEHMEEELQEENTKAAQLQTELHRAHTELEAERASATSVR